MSALRWTSPSRTGRRARTEPTRIDAATALASRLFRRRVRRDALWGMARQGRVGPATGDNRRVLRRSLDLVGGDDGDRVGHGDPERFLRYYWAPLFGRFRLVEFEDVK
jgi:hypothetical protein